MAVIVDVYLTCTPTVLNLPGVNLAVKEEAEDIGQRADVILETVRATTPHQKLVEEVTNPQPSRLTFIRTEKAWDRPSDWLVSLYAPNPSNAYALEFGHQPSGFFKNKPSKAPEGLYILHRAAGLV
jgi:hypothetical protein